MHAGDLARCHASRHCGAQVIGTNPDWLTRRLRGVGDDRLSRTAGVDGRGCIHSTRTHAHRTRWQVLTGRSQAQGVT